MAKPATSAVPGMSIADMRKLLSETRALIDSQTVERPFTMSAPLSISTPVYDFTNRVALGIHEKRAKSTDGRKRKEPQDPQLAERPESPRDEGQP